MTVIAAQVCHVVDRGCTAPAGWASDGAGIPAAAVIGRDHDGAEFECWRCGNAVCGSCSSWELYEHPEPVALGPGTDPFAALGGHRGARTPRQRGERRICNGCVTESERFHGGRGPGGRLLP